MKQHFLKFAFVMIAMAGACLHQTHAQILHTRDFSLILDSAKAFQGNVQPAMRFRNLKEELFEMDNRADLALRISKHTLTMANRFELSRFSGETQVSGGYLYAEYRKLAERKIAWELYGQMHWNEARGLDRKYAGGGSFRWRFITKENLGLYAGTGPFYEYERWDYRGVRDTELIPEDASPVVREFVRLGSYLSLKFKPGGSLFVDISLYHQARLDALFHNARLASSWRVNYKLTRYVGLALLYQNIYDPAPLVPIDKLYNDLSLGVVITL